MRRHLAWFVAAAVFGAFGGAVAAGLDETAVVAHLTAADHEVDEGYFSLGDRATVVVRPGSELHSWLAAHRGQRVRLMIGVTRDGLRTEPALRPGSGRGAGEISRRLKPSATAAVR